MMHNMTDDKEQSERTEIRVWKHSTNEEMCLEKSTAPLLKQILVKMPFSEAFYQSKNRNAG